MDRFEAFARILQNLGIGLSRQTTLLDFGCGEGKLVRSAMSRGIEAYGCDVDFGSVWIDQDSLATLLTENRVRKIPAPYPQRPAESNSDVTHRTNSDYRLPFDDSFFDAVISNQVMEHVHNFPEVVSELHRVMKPGAVFLHMFPPKFGLIEGHINVPLGGVLTSDRWLKLWARLGIRNVYQKDFSPQDTVGWNRTFLDTAVNYVSKRELRKYFEDSFELKFVENEFLRISPRARIFLHPTLYSTFRGRVMFGIRKENPA